MREERRGGVSNSLKLPLSCGGSLSLCLLTSFVLQLQSHAPGQLATSCSISASVYPPSDDRCGWFLAACWQLGCFLVNVELDIAESQVEQK